tara:strand:+ start:4241 stop:4729 length:489 start_codon:yes stop_codon:yes gene_type:complete
MSWLPDNLHEPQAGSYFKPLKGKQNRVRIICDKPLVGHVQWTSDKKPVRWKLGDVRPDADYAEGTKPRVFIAVAVWNYEERTTQVWEITQRTLQESLDALTRDSDFGHPANYDLKITRKGEGMETTYSMVPMPSEQNEDVVNAIAELRVNLDALLHNEDPFG